MRKIAIVGGGPTGLFTAICLSKGHQEIHLFEKNKLPVDKACGEGILYLGKKILKDSEISLKDSYPLNKISFISCEGKKKPQSLKSFSGIALERTKLVSFLLEKIQSTKNITLYHQEAPKEVESKYDFVVYANGANKNLMKKVTRFERIGMRQHYQGEAPKNEVQVYFSSIGEAYVTPLADDSFQIALLLFKNKARHQLKFDEYLKYFPNLKASLDISHPKNDIRGHTDFGLEAINQNTAKTARIGDARIFIDGITGEGLSLGLLMGSKLAKLINQNSYSPQAFDKSIKNSIRHYKFFCLSMLYISYFSPLKRILFILPNRLTSFFVKMSILKS